jgi:hypothetical protein
MIYKNPVTPNKTDSKILMAAHPLLLYQETKYFVTIFFIIHDNILANFN